MSGHTPGPWFIIGTRTKYIEARIHGGLIQEVAACGPTEADNGYGPQQEANANLIAAAPDLLDALESVSKEFELYRWMQNCVDNRAQGSFGIAVSFDDQAVEWQALNDELRPIQNARSAAIARAKGLTSS